MTLKVDGTNGVLQAYDYQVLTTGFSYTFAAGTQTLVINPAGTLATGTITMPASPVDGMVITIESTQQVTVVTVQGNTGQTITGAPSQLIPNQPLSFMYNLANTKWQPFAGGAGRATSLVSGAAVTCAGQTSIDFTGIPSWAKRITVILNNISISGTSSLLMRIGDAGGIEDTNYVSQANAFNASPGGAISTAGYILNNSMGSVGIYSAVIPLCSIGGNTWVTSGVMSSNATSSGVALFGGSKTLSDTLTQVRITTVNGTDTFDTTPSAGSINIMYE